VTAGDMPQGVVRVHDEKLKTFSGWPFFKEHANGGFSE
jgi:hypothetical protein